MSVCKLDTVVKGIQKKLTKQQLKLFKEDIFGHYRDCQNFPFSGVIVYNVLLRQWLMEKVMKKINYGF